VRLAALLLIAPAPAFANGLTTHVWISLRAGELVPAGELGDLVRDPALKDALISGTIFPDGGYAVGDGYGELAHWEPFQLEYLAWIRERFSPPWTDEAKLHIAFLLGMASHGMADQTFDAMYLTRARVYDAASDWEMHSVDEATDVVMAAAVGGQPVPMRFLPREALAETFARAHQHIVDLETLKRGQSLAGFAVAAVEILAADREAVSDYRLQFPWATEHMRDESEPGNPEHEAMLVARYWERIWSRLHGGLDSADFVMAVRPEHESWSHATRADSIESRLTLIFSRRLAEADLSPSLFALESRTGSIPLEIDLFYGDDSHVVHLIPTTDLLEEDYTVTARAGLRSREGDVMPADFRFTVSTKPPPKSGCTAAGSPDGGLWILLLLWLRSSRSS
jgi:hypothetical protein